MARVLIVASLADSLVNFRGDLIEELLACGNEVIAAAPEWSPETKACLESLGVKCLPVNLDRTGLNFWVDFRFLIDLYRLMLCERPDVALYYTIKPIVYGSIAARWVGVPKRAAIITGLGFAFAESYTLRQLVVRSGARLLYRLAMLCTDTVFFQNPDDEADFRRYGLLHSAQRIERIGGSGVNLNRFASVKLPLEPFRFLMVGRLLVSKGVREYVQACQIVKKLYPQANFALVGWLDINPDSISMEELTTWIQGGDIEFLGHLQDVRHAIADCSVFVLPSYREGTPRTVLEAMSIGRAIITTDAPGCRETVINGDNGIMVPIKSASSIAEAMVYLINNPELISRMGLRSRQIAEEKFDVRKVNQIILKGLDL